MRKVDVLRELQEVDSRLDGVRASLAQIRQEIGNREAIDRRNAELAQMRRELARLEPVQRDLELDAETHRAKIAADEKKLYEGTIHNPKELSALADEVAQTRRQMSGIEDKLLEIMEQSEQAAGRVAELEGLLAQESAAWTQRQDQLVHRVDELEASLASGTNQREGLIAGVDAATRGLYETLRRQKNGAAVAHVLQRTCQACRVSLTPALEQRARIGADLVTCPSCGRLLYISIS